MYKKLFILYLFTGSLHLTAKCQDTFAEKLGYPKGSRVLILHVDDAGMSWDSNQGAIQAIEKGVATSMSVMMPCPWVPDITQYLKEHPNTDAGLHLTLTSEWRRYRWGPLTGKQASPGLTDAEGAMWRSVKDVVSHATADEVEAEIRAQVERARTMGFEPTHLDSHMGTLFASPDFMQRYVKIGIEYKIPVMMPGGHMAMISKDLNNDDYVKQIRQLAQVLWNAGLPVLDDLHNVSYNFNYPKEIITDGELQSLATKQYSETIKSLKPGLTMVIMHCTAPTEVFKEISDSGTVRKADLLTMINPEFRKFLEKERFILSTWREVMERRGKVLK